MPMRATSNEPSAALRARAKTLAMGRLSAQVPNSGLTLPFGLGRSVLAGAVETAAPGQHSAGRHANGGAIGEQGADRCDGILIMDGTVSRHHHHLVAHR